MADLQDSTQQQTTHQDWLEFVGRNPRQVRYVLAAAGVLLALVPTILGIKYRGELLWVTIVSILPSLTFFLCVLWTSLRKAGQFSDRDNGRLLVLTLGGMLGLDLFLLSVAVAIQWWDTVGGGLEVWQGPLGWRLWVILIIQVAGLALMFGSLQMARSDERSNVLLRRLLYGYNAALSGLLVLEILCILNIVGFAFLPASDDWTSKSINSLSSRSESILENLTKPTRIFVLMSREDDFETKRNLRALLDNCRAVNDRIQVEFISPDLEREKAGQLAQQYKLGDRAGVLVVYGTEPNVDHQFIKLQSLLLGSEMSMGGPQQRRLFKGESELMTVLNSLSEGKEKPVVYFTQGNGELDLADASSRTVDKGAGILKRRLEADNLTVMGLEFSPIEGRKSNKPDMVISTTVPKDAALVVIAGPTRLLPAVAIKALEDYMNPPAGDTAKAKGKLLVLLDAPPIEEGVSVEQIGLKELLAKFNVEVGDNRVLQIQGSRNPLQVVTAPNPGSRNPVALAFPQTPFVLYNVRTVQPRPQGRPDGANYQAESLLWVFENTCWVETDLSTDPIKLINNLLKPEHIQELRNKLSAEPPSVAVSVTQQPPMTDPHAPPQSDEAKPRLIVCGDATLASNLFVREENRGKYYALLYSMIGWLRERPGSIGIEPKKPDVYDVDPASVSRSRMVLVPAALVFVGIIGLGTGVWVIRRR